MRYCSRCGTQTDESASSCVNCGAGLREGSTPKGNQPAEQESAGKVFGLVVGIIASIVIIGAGTGMTSIRSIRGDSVAEAFYNAMGWGFIGLGVFCIALVSFLYARRSR